LNRKLLYLLAGLGGAGAVVLLARRILARLYPVPYQWIDILKSAEVGPVQVCDALTGVTQAIKVELNYLSPSGDNRIFYELFRADEEVVSGAIDLSQTPPEAIWGYAEGAFSTVEIDRAKLYAGLMNWPLRIFQARLRRPDGSYFALSGDVLPEPVEICHLTFPESKIDLIEFDYVTPNSPARLEFVLKHLGSVVFDASVELPQAPYTGQLPHHTLPVSPAVLADEVLILGGSLTPPFSVYNIRARKLLS